MAKLLPYKEVSEGFIIYGSFSNWLPEYPGICAWASVVFILYIDDIHQSISHSSVLLFADDIALHKEIVTPLSNQGMPQVDLSNVFEWSRKWQLNLNPRVNLYFS